MCKKINESQCLDHSKKIFNGVIIFVISIFALLQIKSIFFGLIGLFYEVIFYKNHNAEQLIVIILFGPLKSMIQFFSQGIGLFFFSLMFISFYCYCMFWLYRWHILKKLKKINREIRGKERELAKFML